jgi:GT2 family glycosyltransferase
MAAVYRLFGADAVEALRAAMRSARGQRRPRPPAPPDIVQTKVPGSASGFAYQPLISLILPVRDMPPQWLRRMVRSVQSQTYPHWELCVCDDGSTAPDTINVLLDLERTEPRLRLKRLPTSSGLSSAANEALTIAKGEFTALLDQGGELAMHALEACAAALNHARDLDVLYSDEAALDEPEKPSFKPDWSPALLREAMYIGHLLIVRRSLIEQAGGFDPFYDGVHDFELVLRLSEQTHRIHHLRDILYHTRRSPGCTEATQRFADKQVAAVNAHLLRLGITAQAEPHPKRPLRAMVKLFANPTLTKISIIVWTKDASEPLARCLHAIYTRTSHSNFEVVVVGNEATDLEVPVADRQPLIRVPFNHGDNSPLDSGVAASSGEILVFIHRNTEVLQPDWLNQMAFLLDDPDVGAVGPMLLFPDHTVQQAGVALGNCGTVDFLQRGLPADADGYFGSLSCTREVSAVTFACIMMRRSDYDALGGLQALYRTHYADIDFCLRLQERGRTIIYTPRTCLIHNDSAISDPPCDQLDRALLLDAWGGKIAAGDPYSRWHPDVLTPDASNNVCTT